MFCPKCHSEYQDKIEECTDCMIPLVDKYPHEPPFNEIFWTKLEPIAGQIHAEMVVEVLKSKKIPNYIQSDWFGSAYGISATNSAGGSVIIYVPENYKQAAQSIQSELLG